MKENVSYENAFQELQEIVDEMENGNVSVDVLTEKVKRATVLIAICKKKLTTTEEDVEQILVALDQNGSLSELKQEEE